MGLDLIAYSRLTYAEDQDAAALADDTTELYNAPGYDRLAPQREGWYIKGPETQRKDLAAGSYGRYSIWRKQLSLAALGADPAQVWDNPSIYAGRPFYELVNFSDCEGAIGATVAAKLSADFELHRAEIFDRVQAVGAWDTEQFKARYDAWAQLFTLAADGGAVKFC